MKTSRSTLVVVVLPLAALVAWLALRSPGIEDAPVILPASVADDAGPAPTREANVATRTPAPPPTPAPAGPRTAGPGGRAAPADSGIHGTVREFGGGPIPGIRIDLVGDDGLVLASTIDDADGRFTFDDPPSHARIVTRDVVGDGPRVEHRLALEPATAAGQLVLWIPLPGVIEGTVLDESRRPVGGAIVASDRKAGALFQPPWKILEGEVPAMFQESKTDAAGHFRLPFLLRGAHRIRAVVDGRSATVDTTAGSRDVTLILGMHTGGAMVDVGGRLTDAVTGVGIADAKVFANRIEATPGGSSEVGIARAITEVDGHFDLQGLEPGTFRLTAQPDGYAPLGTAPSVLTAGRHFLDIAAFPARAVTVRVLQQNGAPLPNVDLHAIDAGGTAVSMLIRGRMPTASMRADAQGVARLTGLPARALTLVAIAGDLLPSGRIEVDLTAPQNDELVIRMPCDAPGRTRDHYFVLRGPEGEPAEITGKVVAEAFDGARLISRVDGRLRSDGRFVFGHEESNAFDVPTIAVAAPLGTCTVKIRVPGYWEVAHRLEAGAESPTQITLRR